MTDLKHAILQGVAPLDRATMQSRVHGELRKRLFLGDLSPGQPLKINTIAEMFGISAQPVREAIRQLIAERALDATANRSARVPMLDREQLEDLRLARLAVEGLATQLAAEKCTSEQIDRLAAITLQAMQADERNDISQSVELNLQFHFTLYRLSGSQELSPIIEGLWLRIGPLVRRAAEAFDARSGRGVQMHLEAIDAMRDKDPQAARAAIEADINRSFEVLQGFDDATD